MINWLLTTFYLLIIIFFISCSTSPKDGQVGSDSRIKQVNLLDSAADFDRLLINQKVPLFKALTLDGVSVDSSYFKRKVTLINFMYIGCAPCMAEAPVLRKLYQHIRLAKFQMLCIAPQTSGQMRQLASYSIPYPIIAECPEEDALGNPSGLGCRELSKRFQVSGYPVILLVDREGIIRYRHGGFSSDHPPKLKAEIESLLR